ncbi:MAG: CBS domain-containing protein [Sandaracinaceae bacterium]|nr:CBS domain-containing protein [Sandaracinaceae bacterium]
MHEAVEEEFRIMEEASKQGVVLSEDALSSSLELLCQHPPALVSRGTRIRDAARILLASREDAVLVLDQGELVGVATARDLLGYCVSGASMDDAVENAMTPKPMTLRMDDTLLTLLAQFYSAEYTVVPIVDEEGYPRHLLGMRDVLEGILLDFDRVIRTTPPIPYRGEPELWGG